MDEKTRAGDQSESVSCFEQDPDELEFEDDGDCTDPRSIVDRNNWIMQGFVFGGHSALALWMARPRRS